MGNTAGILGNTHKGEKNVVCLDMNGQMMANYDVLDLIGEGSCAKVYKCRHKITGKLYAMKTVGMEKMRSETTRKRMSLEIAISKLLKHQHVVSMHHVMISKSQIHIVQDFISGGSLQTLLTNRGKLPELEAKRYMLQLLDGLSYCHSRGVCHRDLKPGNLLLEEGSIKMTDFGLANYIDNDEDKQGFVSPRVGLRPTSRPRLFTECGFPYYVAPEIISTETSGYDGREADIWSFGVILYEMLTGTLPFMAQDFKSQCLLIQDCQYEDAELSRDAAALIRQLLCPASDRLTLAEIGVHPWFRDAKRTLTSTQSSHFLTGKPTRQMRIAETM